MKNNYPNDLKALEEFKKANNRDLAKDFIKDCGLAYETLHEHLIGNFDSPPTTNNRIFFDELNKRRVEDYLLNITAALIEMPCNMLLLTDKKDLAVLSDYLNQDIEATIELINECLSFPVRIGYNEFMIKKDGYLFIPRLHKYLNPDMKISGL